jgi:hypothetical protein
MAETMTRRPRKPLPKWLVRTRRVLEILGTAGGCLMHEPVPPGRSWLRYFR